MLANVGGNLTLTSTQDSSHYAEQDQSASAGLSLCIPPICYGSSSGGASVSDTNIRNSYQSVTGETGIAAGSGGFDIHVGGTTALTGAALASTATPDKNVLDTGNLTVANLHNSQSDSASQVGATFNSGGSLGSNLLSNSAGAALSLAVPQGGSHSSDTLSSIAPGTIVVRNDPTQDLSGIDRSATTLTGNGVADNFNVNTIKANQAIGQAAGYVGMRAAGDIEQDAGLKNGSAGAIALHAVVGGAVAALGGGNAAQGAAGAAAGEAVLNVLPNQTNPTLVEGVSTLVGGLVGGGAGAATANQGELYNYLNHLQRQQEAQQLATCTNSADCQKIRDYWNGVSASQSATMADSLPLGSYTGDLLDINPSTSGYDTLLATAIAQSVSNGAINPVIAQDELILVQQLDGVPKMQAYNASAAQAQQANLNAIGYMLLGFNGPALVDEGNPDEGLLNDAIAGEVASGKATTIVVNSSSNAAGVNQAEGVGASSENGAVPTVSGDTGTGSSSITQGDNAAGSPQPIDLSSPTNISLPAGYTMNNDGTVTGPGGGSLTIVGSTSDGSLIFQRANGGAYFTVDPVAGTQTPSAAPSTLAGQTPGSIVAANNAVSKAAEEEVSGYIDAQSGLQVVNQVRLTDGATTCVADCVVSGSPNATVQLPPGFVDVNGDPITSINLGSSGQAIIEIKTGNGPLTTNQSVVYPAVGKGSVEATGTNAEDGMVSGPVDPSTPVIIIRKP